ncbi:glycoside hydrolase family 99-like domain-containing protein [Thiorhodococcus minor]|uniref:Glycosyltransferase n=1 Tax=Thiorhodococcus minor TaxID=57489 RepID=A0A6M0JUG4_9GAMM|nr:glycoside hydrolase family 99-like domain-containing protein [Thiorhodococcus minor]NEV60561.1 glycosyltransferase [Thiorhodococcus minor]
MVFNLLRPLWRLLPLDIPARQRMQRRLFRTLPFLFRKHPGFKAFEQARQRGELWRGMGGTLEDQSFQAVPLLDARPPASLPARLIAFYLPQFHPIPENDAWWGRGFTEWTNVVRGRPQFPGHYQPHLPGELGFYDLRAPEVMARQVELAKLYGIGGFAFYYYWFAGKRLLERPLEDYLSSSLDLPFCLCWANENWSRRWDGRDDQILMAQEHSPEDDLAFIQAIARYLRDRRYIRVGARPLLMVYRPALLPDPAATARRWRGWCRDNGIGEIYLAYTQSFESEPPEDYGFDAAVEFPPNNSHPVDITKQIQDRSPDFKGTIYDWTIYPERSRHYEPCDYRLFRGVNPSWDNEARRRGRGAVFLGSTPAGYRQWLENAIGDTLARISEPSERLVFINAWNEWAEGAHLEPDDRHGYAYLQATRDALLRSRVAVRREILLVAHDAYPHGAQYLALRMAERLTERFGYRVTMVVLGPGPLLADYAAVADVHRLDSDEADRGPGRRLAKMLRERGLDSALVNSTASGRFLPSLRAAGFRTIALVHELPELIRRHALQPHARYVGESADVVVFPAGMVRDGFAQFAKVTEAQARIRPQGLYKENALFRQERTKAIRAQLRDRLGLPADARIVLGVGYGDHRKGVDLFVRTGLALAGERKEVYCIWVGKLDAAMQEAADRLLAAVDPDVKGRFIFPGHTTDTDAFYAGADIYAMTSREDPFPSVVLESLAVGVPVVAFEGAGGFCELAPTGAIRLAPAEDSGAFATEIARLLDDEAARHEAGLQGHNLVARDFGFERYLLDLLAETTSPVPRISVVVPSFNYRRYLPARIRSILEQSLPVYELIVLDDCSTDGSREWLAEELPRLAPEAQVVLNRENSGSVFVQWLEGVRRARGDYVWIAEADDLAAPDFLDEAMRGFADSDVVLSFTQSRQIDPDGEVLCGDYLDYVADISRDRWRQPYRCPGEEEIGQVLAVKNSIPNVSGAVFRRAALLDVLQAHIDDIRSYKVAGDWVVYVELLKRGAITFSPRALNDHRRHPSSVTLSRFNLEQLSEIVGVQRWIAANHDVGDDTRAIADAYAQALYEQFGLANAKAPKYGDCEALRGSG